MPHKINWAKKPSIILGTFWSRVNIEEYQIFNNKIVELIDESDEEEIHFISNNYEVTDFPMSLVAVKKNLSILNNARLGWVLIIEPKAQMPFKFMAKILAGLGRKKVEIFRNQEELSSFLISEQIITSEEGERIFQQL